MSKDLSDLMPTRTMSGRRSKPSMDLLVDNQRVLSQYIIPKKTIHNERPQHHLDSINFDSHTAISLKMKSEMKSQKRALVESDTSSKNKNDSYSNDSECTKPQDILSQTPYITLRLNKIDINDSDLLTKEDYSCTKEDDDLPLAKVFPDFRPNITSPENGNKRPHLVLPPKKKIKFVDLNELIGFAKPMSPLKTPHLSPKVSVEDKVSVLKSSYIVPSIRADVLSLSKIPRIPKKLPQVNGSITNSTEKNSEENSTEKNSENSTEKNSENLIEKNSEEDFNDPKLIPDLSMRQDESNPSIPLVPRATPRRCIREKCTNVAIEDSRWDKEFCSPDCAIDYSKYIVREWLRERFSDQMLEMQM